MKLTKQQKIELLSLMLREYKDRSRYKHINPFGYEKPIKMEGMCKKLVTAAHYLGINDLVTPEDIPELLIHRPVNGWKKNTLFWWRPDNVRIRIRAIETAIHNIMTQ